MPRSEMGTGIVTLTYFELRPVMEAFGFQSSPWHSIHLDTNDLNGCAHRNTTPTRAMVHPDRIYFLWLWRTPCAMSVAPTTSPERKLA